MNRLRRALTRLRMPQAPGARVDAVASALATMDRDGLWDEVDQVLARRAGEARLSPALIAICRQISFDVRRRMTMDWIACTTAILAASILIDVSYDTGSAAASLLGKGILVPLAAMLLVVLWRRPRSPATEGLGIAVYAAAAMAGVTLSGMSLGPAGMERYVSAGAFTMSIAVVLVPLETRAILMATPVAAGFYAVAQHANPEVPLATTVTCTLYLVGVNLCLAAARRAMNIALKRGVLMRLRDARRVAVLAEANGKLEYLATRDMLTGLFNRHAMRERLAAAAASLKPGEPLAVAMLDLDEFKRLNDALGHAGGDHCLSTFGALIADHVACGEGTAARIGAEEFLLLLPRHDAQDAFAVVEGIRTALEEMALPHPGSRVAPHVTLSAGIAVFAGRIGTRPNLEALQRAADEALYEAKDAGRNRTRVARGTEAPRLPPPRLRMAPAA